MSDYKSISGFKVPSTSTDPSNIQEGQVWFNNSTNGIKFHVYSPGGTSVTAAPNIICSGVKGNFGESENAVMAVSGGNTVKFNGTSWSSSGGSGSSMNPSGVETTGGLGSSNDALAFGSTYSFPCGPYGWSVGYADSCSTARYNGSSWSSSPDFPYRGSASGNNNFGSVNGAVIMGQAANNVYTFNGTSFSTGPSKSYGSCFNGLAAGNPNSGISVQGGNISPANTEKWNGTSWSTGSSIPKGLVSGGTAIGSSNTDVTAGGGATYNSGTSGPITTNTCFYKYDGTNWSTTSGLPSHPQISYASTGQGTGSSGMMWSIGGLQAYTIVQSPAGLCTKNGILS